MVLNLRFLGLSVVGGDKNIVKKSILVSFSFIFLIIAIYSQEKTTSVIPSKSVTDKNKPSVYITFERFGGSEPIVKSNEDKSARISLRLHNNTSLPIAVDANWDIRKVTPFPITLSDGGKGVTVSDGAELEICYEAEAMPQRKVEEFLKIQVPKQIPSYYNCRLGLQRSGRSDTWIRSGNSIVFSVPQEFLTKNLKIYTLFNYEWESENGQMKADEPHHQVYFYSTDLPYSQQK